MFCKKFILNKNLNYLKQFKYFLKSQNQFLVCSFSNNVSNERTSLKFDLNSANIDNDSKKIKSKPISKAMRAYLKRAVEYDRFMRKEKTDFEIGKRHLANMMGENPENFTQQDVDAAIEYLFPSGLFEPRARPIMKPPEEIFPKKKSAEFDETGRPHHYLFYTGRPNFYQLMHDIVENIKNLNQYEDEMNLKNQLPDPTKTANLESTRWVTIDELSNQLIEKINEYEYKNFMMAIDRLSGHPYSYRVIDFLHEFRKSLMVKTTKYEIAPLKYDENGVAYVTTYECLRKRARGHVTVRSPGTGKITINGENIEYFKDLQPREQVLFPLIFTGMTNKVDIEAFVEGGGTSGQAGAIRWGIAMGLRNFVDKHMIEQMKLAGLLQRDFRTKERKKPGQEGARRKFTWKKR